MAKSSDKLTLRWLFKNSKSQHFKLITLIIGNVIYAASSVAFALMCRGIVDGAVNQNKSQLISYALGLIGIIVGQLVLNLYCNFISEVIHSGIEMDLRSILFKKLLKKEYEDVSVYHSGEILNRMFSDVKVIADGIVQILPSMLNMLTRLVSAVAVLLALDMGFTLPFLIAGTALFFITRFFRKKIKTLHKDVQKKEGVVRSFLQETVESLLMMKVFGCDKKITDINDNNQKSHYKSRIKRISISIIANAGFGFIFRAGYIYALMWGARGIYFSTMTYGTLTAILQLVNQIQTPFANLSAVFPKFYGMIASAERIIELLEIRDEKSSDKKLSYSDFEKIHIDGLSFSYGENHVLKDVNIEISKGDFVSLTGLSGGGKSTLFLLLLGAYTQQKGNLIFKGSSGDYFAGCETRHLFAYVPQGNFLLSGTVAENIGFLCENPTLDDIKAAAEIACAREFIEQFPDGFDTKIGENGFGISEGQAQRIAIARALLSKAPFLLLDEATSALDEQTEAKLLENIENLKDRTLLIVTHRPAALKICSKHLILNKGNLEYGNQK